MTTYTITGPDGKDYSMDGPAGATQEQVIAQISKNMPQALTPQAAMPQPKPGGASEGTQQHSDLGDLWNRAISNLPPGAQKYAASLAPSWSHNPPSYSPYKPAQPGNMPNDAINPVGTDAQMVGATAAAGGMGGLAAGAKALQDRAAANAPPPPPPGPSVPSVAPTPPPPPLVKPGPTQGPWGTAPAPAPVIRGPGGKWMPNPAAQPQPAPAASPAPMAAPSTQPGHMSAANYRQQMGLPPPGSDPAIPPNPVTAAPPLPGTSPQQLELLRQAMHVGGHMLGGPVGSMAARGLTKVLGM